MGNQQQLYDMAVRICEAAGRGEDITALAAQIEPELKRFHKREHISGMNLCYPQDALWDVLSLIHISVPLAVPVEVVDLLQIVDVKENQRSLAFFLLRALQHSL